MIIQATRFRHSASRSRSLGSPNDAQRSPPATPGEIRPYLRLVHYVCDNRFYGFEICIAQNFAPNRQLTGVKKCVMSAASRAKIAKAAKTRRAKFRVQGKKAVS